jgi:hypothetical protein
VTRAQKRKRIEALVAAWQSPLGLANWTVSLSFDGGCKEQASCSANPEYRDAKLNFNLRRIGPQEIDEVVAHELMHCHGWAVAALALNWAGKEQVKREAVRQAEELLTTAVSRAFLPLLPRVVT